MVFHKVSVSTRFVAILAAAVFASSTSSCTRGTSPEFDEYLTKYGRSYGPNSDDYARRVDIFHTNLRSVQAQNAKRNRRWTAGLNHFADRTEEELEHLHGWRPVHMDGGEAGGSMFLETESEESSFEVAALNETIDWSRLSMASKVPDQGGCGSCWALATSSMLEGRFEVANEGGGRTFSAQQLVNCVPNPRSCGGTGGCQGATVELAMSYIEKRGLKTNEEVQYQAHLGRCQAPVRGSPRFSSSSFLEVEKHERHEDDHHDHDQGSATIGLRSWKKLPTNKALPLMNAVQNGPVAISVGAKPFHFYKGGVFDDCPKDSVINHAVTLFGYGQTESGDKYWNVRNSWGADWGERGYIRLLRGASMRQDDEYCGIDHNPKVGVACKPYPKQSKVCGMCGMLFDSVAAQLTSIQPTRREAYMH